MVLVIFQIHWQQNQLQDHRLKASTKTSKKTSTQTPSQMQKMAGGRNHLHQSLAQQVSRQHSQYGKCEHVDLSQWQTPDLERTREVKQLWTPAHPQTCHCGPLHSSRPPRCHEGPPLSPP